MAPSDDLRSEPSVGQVLEDRKAHRDAIARLFRLSPLQDIEPETLRAITPHYQQRISECRRQLGMVLQNRARTADVGSGRKIKRDGAYRWYPDGLPLGRDAGQENAPVEWPTVHSRPFAPPFELKP